MGHVLHGVPDPSGSPHPSPARETAQQLGILVVCLERTWLKLTAPTWNLTTICDSNSRGSDTPTQTYMQENTKTHKILFILGFFGFLRQNPLD